MNVEESKDTVLHMKDVEEGGEYGGDEVDDESGFRGIWWLLYIAPGKIGEISYMVSCNRTEDKHFFYKNYINQTLCLFKVLFCSA